MTPITIEPNSGTKMAGVKVKKSSWTNISFFAEILFVGKRYMMTKDQNDNESTYLLANDYTDNWLLYEEPKPEVKKVLMAPAVYTNLDNRGNFISARVFSSEQEAKDGVDFALYKFKSWPARVVLKNCETNISGESIKADLYFEVEE